MMAFWWEPVLVAFLALVVFRAARAALNWRPPCGGEEAAADLRRIAEERAIDEAVAGVVESGLVEELRKDAETKR